MIPNKPLKNSDCQSGNLILQILWSCVHAEEKHRLNRLFSGNLLFNQNKTVQFSGLPMPPFFVGGVARSEWLQGHFSWSLLAAFQYSRYFAITRCYNNHFKDHRASCRILYWFKVRCRDKNRRTCDPGILTGHRARPSDPPPSRH